MDIAFLCLYLAYGILSMPRDYFTGVIEDDKSNTETS